MNDIHKSMTMRYDPIALVDKARNVSGEELYEWLEIRGQVWAREADDDLRPFVHLLTIMKEGDRYKSAGIKDWSEFCDVLRIKPDMADQLMIGLKLIGADEKATQDRLLGAAGQFKTTEKQPENLTPAEYGAMGGRGRKASNNIRGFKWGTDPAYLAARIKRDAPLVAEAAERGQYRSVREAALAAGIVSPRMQAPTDVRKLAAYLRKRYREDELRTLAALLICSE